MQSKINEIKVAHIACVIFCIIRILVEIIPFVKAVACSNVEIPPNEIINVQSIVAVLNERGISDSIIQPFVISKIPEKIAVITSWFMPKYEKTDTILTKIKLPVITSISTKVKQITPPISSIEEIDDVTLSEKFDLLHVWLFNADVLWVSVLAFR